MSSKTFDVGSQYFSGQGVLMIGRRDANGIPTGLRPVGNCSDLKISVATTIVSHKNSQDGQRAIDSRLQTETNTSLSFTIDNWIAKNLAQALRGDATSVAAGSTTESILGYAGLVTPLSKIKPSNVVLTAGTTLTEYVDAVTPWDYQVNNDAGSVKFNDGSSVAPATLGNAATAITVGTTTAITVTVPASAAVGGHVMLFGATGADAAFVNGKTVAISTKTGTSAITVALNTTGKTITLGSLKVLFIDCPITVSAAYDFEDQQLVDTLTEPLTDNFLRFEGLNTVDTGKPVVVEVFRFQNDPLKELALLSDTYGAFQIEGSVLVDYTKTSGSKYFTVKAKN
jgi:hypothetical protein